MRYFSFLAALFFSIALSAWLGRAALHTDDTGILVGLIGTGAFLVGMVEPRHPWMWGLIVPTGIVIAEAWSRKAGIGGVYAIAAFTLAVAATGAYIGSFLRRLFSARSREVL